MSAFKVAALTLHEGHLLAAMIFLGLVATWWADRKIRKHDNR